MPEGSYPFPIYSGLLEPGHYNKISTAIWLFLWCISSVTKDKEDEEGVTWGIVLGNKPIKLSEISERFGVNDKTVSRWLDTLEQHQYIRVTRAPRGLILSVKNSKKWTDKNVRSQQSDQTNMSDHGDSDKTEMSDHNPKISSDQTNMSDLKDIKDLITTTPITTMDFEDETTDSKFDGMIELLNAYSKMHGKFDHHVKPREREAMGKMVAGGMPNPFTIRTMESLLEAKREREGERFKMPTSFLYYVDGIEEAWYNSQTTNAPIVGVAPGTPDKPKKMSKQQREQQQEIDDLQRFIEEEERREQSGSG